MPRHATPRLLAVLLLACAALAAVGASNACAFGIKSFEGRITRDPAGNPVTQAGSHPYAIEASVEFDNHENAENGTLEPGGNVKDVSVELPAGLIGDPTATPKCTQEQFYKTAYGISGGCSAATQVGTAVVRGFKQEFTSGIFNLEPNPGVPAEFGLVVSVDSVYTYATVRSDGDYGLNFNLRNISQALPIISADLTFWGNPADSRHDGERICSTGSEGCPSGAPARPFLTMPTSCEGVPGLRLSADSWQQPGAFVTTSFQNRDQVGTPVALEGCERVPFAGGIATALDTPLIDAPSGLTVDLSVPQTQSAEGIATANLKAASVTLPPGVSINPSAANGRVGCSVAQIGLGTESAPSCPDNSKVGSTEIDTPLLPAPLTGSVFLARQAENPFSSLIAIYAVAEGQGVRIKLPGRIALDPSSGQVVATFENAPQLPFEDFKLSFFDGPRAALATPVTCGTQPVAASLVPWSGGAAVSATASVTVSSRAGASGCPASAAARPFDLALEAGTTSDRAGAHSSFVFAVSRGDGRQEIGTVDATLPPGLLATLRGVPTCDQAQAAVGACGAGSLIGSVVAGAGAGTDPFYAKDGRAYLTGPYKGAPLGLDFVVPAVAGPLDLGTVNVRAALFVDPVNAQVTVKTDPLPRILQGIPLRLRSLAVDVDRPAFILNPTACEASQVTAHVTSTEGAIADLSDRFGVSGCNALKFAPKLRLSLKGGTRRNGNPALTAVLTQRPGQSNIDRVSVLLPHSEFLEQSHIRTVCTRTQFAADACPAGSVYGYAEAATPLLDQPLRGPVYLRSSSHTLPDLVAALRGPASQPIEIDLSGRIDSVRGALRASFESVPDAPVSRFVLRLRGGKKSLLVNSTDVCGQVKKATIKATGQNGAGRNFQVPLRAKCAKGPRKGGGKPKS